MSFGVRIDEVRKKSFSQDKMLWEELFALTREVESFKVSIYGNSLEAILARLEEIEKEIDILLSYLCEFVDKKSDFDDK